MMAHKPQWCHWSNWWQSCKCKNQSSDDPATPHNELFYTLSPQLDLCFSTISLHTHLQHPNDQMQNQIIIIRSTNIIKNNKISYVLSICVEPWQRSGRGSFHCCGQLGTAPDFSCPDKTLRLCQFHWISCVDLGNCFRNVRDPTRSDKTIWKRASQNAVCKLQWLRDAEWRN